MAHSVYDHIHINTTLFYTCFLLWIYTGPLLFWDWSFITTSVMAGLSLKYTALFTHALSEE